MKKAVIVFDKGMLISGVPVDWHVQGRLIEDGLLFDNDGVSVTADLSDGHTLDESLHYCIPLRGIVRLMQSIGSFLAEKTGRSIELVYADPILWGEESPRKAAITNCLNAAFPNDLPRGFQPDYWQGTTNFIDTIRRQSSSSCIVLVTANRDLISEVASAKDVTVVESLADLLGLMPMSSDGAGYDPYNTQSIDLMITALVRAVDVQGPSDLSASPWLILTAYLSLLRQYPDDFANSLSRYTSALSHTFVTSILFSRYFEKSHENNHARLKAIFKSITDEVTAANTAGTDMNNCNVQVYLETILFYFTKFFRGKYLEGQTLATLIPEQMIAIFQQCVDIDGHPSIVSRLFLRWFSAQFHNYGMGRALQSDLVQLSTSFTEQWEWVDRISRVMDELVRVLTAEIGLYKTGRRISIDDTVAEQIIGEFNDMNVLPHPSVPTASAAAAVTAHPRRAFEQCEAAVMGKVGLMTVDGDTNRRVEVFTVSTDTTVETFLARHIKVEGQLRATVLSVRTIHAEPQNSYVVAVVVRDDSGKTLYYRRDDRLDFAGRKVLKQNRPLNNLPILFVQESNPVNEVREIRIEWTVPLSVVYLGAKNIELRQPNPMLAPTFAAGSVLKRIYDRLNAVPAGEQAAAQEILAAMRNLELISDEMAFLSFDPSGLRCDSAQLVRDMQAVYKFMRGRQEDGRLFSHEVTPLGIAATVNRRGKKWLAVWNLLLSLGLVTADATLVWGYPDIVPITDGDVFFYLTALNTQLMRAAILTVYVATITWIFKELTNYLFKFIAQLGFSRELIRLPKTISHAIISGSTASRFFPAQVYRILFSLRGHQEIPVPILNQFMDGLRDFANISEASHALPGRLCLELMNLGSQIVEEVMKVDDATSSYEERILKRIREAEKTLLKGVATVTCASAIVAAVFAGIYYNLLNTGEGDTALTSLTIDGLYALGIAALYLLYKFGGSVAESVITLGSNRSVHFFGGQGNVVTDARLEQQPHRAELTTVAVVAAPRPTAGSVNHPEEQPLLRDDRRARPGRGRSWLSCTVS